MKIGFSARGLSVPSGGVKQFILSLVPALAEAIEDDELFVFYDRRKYLGLAKSCEEIFIKSNNRIIWDFCKLPLFIKKHKIDIMIFPKNVIPFFTGTKNYVVVHDLAHFDKQLNAYQFKDSLYMKTMMPLSVKRACGVFAISEHTKKDIIKYTDCSAEKISVINEAADSMYKQIEDKNLLQSIRAKYNLPQKFILYTGSLSPRKNIVRLLDAYNKISKNIEHSLIFTASKSWKDAPVYQKIKDLGIADKLFKLGYVEHNDMPALYNLADLYVYPSLYEGFGLPVLEAMQCGCPVVASKATSIPEVAGDAALLINPYNVDAMAQAMLKVLTDKNVSDRLKSKGLQQAPKFSWDKCAKQILRCIRQK